MNHIISLKKVHKSVYCMILFIWSLWVGKIIHGDRSQGSSYPWGGFQGTRSILYLIWQYTQVGAIIKIH